MILIVEDEEGIRDALHLALSLEGYSAITASNGQEGLDSLAKGPLPCVILLDLMMPVMNGWEFAEAIERMGEGADIPIVVVTAFAEEAKTLKKAREILKKPVDIHTLLKCVEKYCGPPVANGR